MLYELLYPLSDYFIGFNVFRYITFRTIGAILTALLISLLVGPWLINRLKRNDIGQRIREDVPLRHRAKEGTPTMGGILLIVSALGSTVLWGKLSNGYLWIAAVALLGFGLIGLWDDCLKLRRRKGMPGKVKFLLQVVLSVFLSLWIWGTEGFEPTLTVPFFKGLLPDLGLWWIPFSVFVLTGTSNAVNLTDGLDGLAIGPVMVTAGTFGIFSYLSGHSEFARYLLIPYIREAGELTILCGAILGGGLGFLWFNAYPAQIFMGDVGALALGGGLATVAVLLRQELLLIIVGGVFVAETLSVILQVLSFKLRGRRVFRMAPLHHHFELKGWAEPKIIVRFWIISIVLGLLALSTLKLR
ncbi:MAG: phospho-N-acetylmuramoyl-pentapeptide-transferase [Deltaproteobacteria bacterium]|nr:MAG: phospho-N-acetylmuramoyl-pentapeptide-transferase [Deltaproteobacteria bacterium]